MKQTNNKEDFFLKETNEPYFVVILKLIKYYRVHHGQNLLSPQKQEEILKVVAMFGSIEGIEFDHYVTDWDFE